MAVSSRFSQIHVSIVPARRARRVRYRVLPDRLTYFPLAYHARKHHECLQKMEVRQKKSYAYRLPGAVAP